MTPDEIRKLAAGMSFMPLHIQEPHTAKLLRALADVYEAVEKYRDLDCDDIEADEVGEAWDAVADALARVETING